MSDLNNQYIIAQEEHDYNKKYEKGTIVKHTIDDVVTAYIAKKNVPQFISILNENYWKNIASATSSGGGGVDIFDEDVEATDTQRNKALANVSNQTADSITGKMGYKVLDSTKAFAEQVTAENTIYEIRDVFDLGGSNFNIPANTRFKFNGGIIKNGYLSGEFHSDNPVDVSSFGLVYNDSSAAIQNANYLKILSNVTNKVNLVLSDELYIKSSNMELIPQNYVLIDGRNNTIHIDLFYGFLVSKDSIIRNCNITSNNSSVLLQYNSSSVSTYNPNILFEDNDCDGNIRVLLCENVCDENFTKYLNSIEIRNNRFKNIYSTYGGNMTFSFVNCNYVKLCIEGNNVHNFYSTFVSTGITNNSVYSTYISAFYEKYGRNTIIKNNFVYNDIDYYPWTKVSAVAYFVFALIEAGTCYYENNTIKNLIDRVRDGETSGDNTAYDAYLSVDNLYSKNNNIKNCIKEGRVGEFIKCKRTNSGSAGIRYIENNIYELDDLLELDENLFSAYACLWTDLNCDTITIDNCKFNVANWGGVVGHTNSIRKCLLSNNEFTLNNITGSINACVLTCNNAKIEEVIITNNKVLVTNNNPTFGLIGYNATFAGYIICNDNTMQNCKLIGSDNILYLNLISNNNIVTSVNDNYLIDNIATSYYDSPEHVSRNIYNIPSSMITSKPYTYRWFNEKENIIKIGDIPSVRIIEFRLPDYSENYITNVQFLIEILNLGISFKGELNFSKVNTVNTMYYIQYDKIVSAVTDTSSHYLYNLNGNPTNESSVSNRAIRLVNSSTRGYFYLNVYANDIVRITKVAKKVKSINSLENNVIKDSGKLIMWNGTAWVNLDGTPLS